MIVDARVDEILAFWLGSRGHEPPSRDDVARWFEGDAALDAEIEHRFGDDVEAALAGARDAWGASDLLSRVALVVLLDQFPRNLFRVDPRAFAGDEAAIGWTRGTSDAELPKLHPVERYFVLLPFMHSESLADQEEGVRAFRRAATEVPPAFRGFYEAGVEFAERHRVVIERFGRFPHRNAVLGRQPTAEERAFLTANPGGF